MSFLRSFIRSKFIFSRQKQTFRKKKKRFASFLFAVGWDTCDQAASLIIQVIFDTFSTTIWKLSLSLRKWTKNIQFCRDNESNVYEFLQMGGLTKAIRKIDFKMMYNRGNFISASLCLFYLFVFYLINIFYSLLFYLK